MPPDPDQEQVGLDEVISHAQQSLAGDRSDRVCAAVAEVQRSGMPPLAEAGVSVKCHACVRLVERHGLDGILLQEPRQCCLPPRPEPRRQHDSRLQLAEAAAHRLKLEAGRQAITEWELENGPLTEAELADGLARARSSLGRAPAPAAERQSA
jgi:hypothetical protein